MRFKLGQTVITAHCKAVLGEVETALAMMWMISRHAKGDWGDLDAHDRAVNEAALKSGDRLLSAYTMPSKTKIWIITEADRSVTTILLPSDY